MERAHPISASPAARGTAVLLLLIASLATGCGQDAAEEAADQRVVGEGLGIALTVPADAGFTVEENAGPVLRLRFEGEGDLEGGILTYAVSEPEAAGPNLVVAVNGRREEIESRPEGHFFGQIELGSHLGPAYSTRGRYRDASGAMVEEIRIFALHPQGDRLLHLTYGYPVPLAETHATRRRDQALAALGWVEPSAEGGAAEAGGGEG
jgi:hypothetical protein